MFPEASTIPASETQYALPLIQQMQIAAPQCNFHEKETFVTHTDLPWTKYIVQFTQAMAK